MPIAWSAPEPASPLVLHQKVLSRLLPSEPPVVSSKLFDGRCWM
jgi:hypothetical protein